MGQAKNRGTKEERINQALGSFTKVSVDKIKKDLGLSVDVLFCGYVIHIIETDEFLSSFDDHNDATFSTWSVLPDLALCYKDFKEAVSVLERLSKPSRQTVIAHLWEDERRYLVTISD